MKAIRDSKEYRIRQGRLDKIRGALIGNASLLAQKVENDWAGKEREVRKIKRLERLLKKARDHKRRLYQT